MKVGFERLSVLFAAVAVFAALTAPPAGAVAVGPLEVRIDVDQASWGADGYVEESLSGAAYTSVLTVTGFETDGSRHGTIIDFDTDTGNPSTTSTTGGFDSRYSVMVYTLAWTSVLGTTGVYTRVCVEVRDLPSCSPS